MLLASEATRTITASEFVFALLQAVALVVTLVAVKLVLYRRRMREEYEEACALHERRKRGEKFDHASGAGAKLSQGVGLSPTRTAHRPSRIQTSRQAA
jgi:hypothetical protein